MAEGSLITDEMRAAIGIEGESAVSEVEKGAIRKFAEAIGDPNPLYYDEEYAKSTKYGGIIAPPSFLCTLRTTGGVQVKVPVNRRLNGGSEFEVIQPLRPGEVISARTKITDFTEREGRLGKMVIMVQETSYKNQKGELVGKFRSTTLMY